MKLAAASLVFSSMIAMLACGRAGTPRSEPPQATIASEPVTHITSATGPASPADAPDARAAAPATAPALEGTPIERLTLDDGSEATLAVPVGARDKRAILVGVHGAGDRPEWSCSEWQAVTANWAFVVCPHGVPHPTAAETFVWSSAESIAARADQAVRALKARHGAWVSDGPLIYGGWSQGASLAAQVVALRPGTYDRVALVEIGHTPLDPSQFAAGLVAGGVQRAVITCESAKCRTFAASFDRAARRRQLAVVTSDLGARPHLFDDPVFRALGSRFAWLVDDQPRFAGLGAAVDALYATD